jgi:hypothetical protein
VIGGYAAIVSTLSVILAVKVYRAANPKVDLDWLYEEADRNLSVTVLNTGRADVTIATIDLYVVRHKITRRSPSGKYFNLRINTIDHIATKLWIRKPKAVSFPARLASNSMFSVQVKNDAIRLPSQYPLDELLLKFVAKFPGGKAVAHLGGDVLRHFVGIDPDVPVRFPSPGSLPAED